MSLFSDFSRVADPDPFGSVFICTLLDPDPKPYSKYGSESVDIGVKITVKFLKNNYEKFQ
jgi:hypothetical protein